MAVENPVSIELFFNKMLDYIHQINLEKLEEQISLKKNS